MTAEAFQSPVNSSMVAERQRRRRKRMRRRRRSADAAQTSRQAAEEDKPTGCPTMQCTEGGWGVGGVWGGKGHEATRCLLTSVKAGRTDATTYRAAVVSSCAEMSKKFGAAPKQSTLLRSGAATSEGSFFIFYFFSHWTTYLPNSADSDARCLHLVFFFLLLQLHRECCVRFSGRVGR